MMITFDNKEIVGHIAYQVYPLDNSWLNYNSINFNYTVNTATSIKNCSLFINGGLNQTNSSAINTTGGINSFSLNLGDGSYSWNVFCVDTYSAFAINKTSRQSYYNDRSKYPKFINPV